MTRAKGPGSITLKGGGSALGASAILALLTLCVVAPAFAQTGGQDTAGWQAEISPYIWMTGITGDIQAGESSASIGVSFSDILNSLDFGLMGMVQVRKGRMGFVFDGMYARLTKEGEGSGISGAAVHGEIVTQIYSLALSYRALEWLSIVGGARLMPLSGTLEVTSGVLEGQQASGSSAVLDGFVGGRIEVPLIRRLQLELYGDIGAGDSKLSWQTLAGLKVGLSKSVSTKIGYRCLGIENETPDLQTKIVEGGFYIGVGFRL